MARRNTIEIAIEARDEASRAIQRAVRTVSGEFSSLNASLRRTGADSGQISRINAELRRANPRLLEAEIESVRDSLRRMGASSRHIENVTREMRNAENASEEAERSFKSSFDGLKKAAKTAAVAVGAAAATLVGIVGKMGIDFNAKMEQSAIAWETLLGGAEQAKTMLKELQQMGAKTPFEFEGLDTSAKLLKAMGVDSSMLIPYLTSIGDAVSAIGGGQEELQGVSMAIGQMLTKGKVSAEEMNQLAERGIPAWELMAQKLGMSKQELMKLSSEGKIYAEQAVPAMLAAMQSKFGGAMDAQSKTFNGQMSTLKDNLRMVIGEISGPVFDILKQAMPTVIAEVDKFGKWVTNNMPQIKKTIESSINIAVSVFKGFGDAIGFVKDNADLLIPVLAGVTSAIVAQKAISIVVGLYKAWKLATVAQTTVQWLLNAAMTANPIGLVAAAIGIVITAVGLLHQAWVNDWGGIQEKTRAVGNAIIGYFQAVWSATKLVWTTIAKFAMQSVQKILDNMAPMFKLIGEVAPEWKKKFDDIRQSVGNSVDGLTDKFGDLKVEFIDSVGGVIDSAKQVKESFSSWKTPAKEAAKATTEAANTTQVAAAQTQAAMFTAGEAYKEAGEKTKTAKEKIKELSDKIIEAADILKDYGNVLSQIARTKLDIFSLKLGETGDKAKLLTAQMNTLSQQIANQTDVVQVAGKAYEDMKKLKGANAAETKKLELAYLQERSSLETLRSEYRTTNKALKEQGNAFANMAKDIQKVADTYRKDMASTATEYWNKISEVNNRLREDEKRLTDDYKNQIAQRASALKNFAGLFDEIATKEVSGAGLLKNLRDQVGAFKTWANDIKALAARGVNQGLIAELQEMGPKAGSEIAALNSLTQEQLTEYVALWQEKAQAANVQALGELDYLRTETESKISQLRQAAMAEIEQYKAEWAAKNAEIAQNALNAVAEIEKAYTELTGKSTTFGKNFMQGIIDGMKSKFIDLIATVNNVKMAIGANGAVSIMPTSGTISGQTSVDSLNAIIAQAKASYANATNDKERAAAHALAEWARSQGGSVGGGESSRFKVPGLATGGDVRDDGVFLVGENGPELMSNKRGARVTPLDKATQSVVNNYHVQLSIKADDVSKLADLIRLFESLPQVARAMGVAK